MLKLAFASLLLAGGALVIPLDGPPDSLEPDAARGQVRFSHRHRKIISCHPREGTDPLRCRSKRENADSAASLELRPVKGSEVADKDKRSPIHVEFASSRKRAERWITLDAGTWEVRWSAQGDEQKPTRFDVKDQDRYKIWLRSVSGKCMAEESECRLDPAPQSHRVVVPRRHRAP